MRLRRGGVDWRIDPRVCDEILCDDGLRIDEWRHDGVAQVVKDGRHRTVYRVELPAGTFYVKHFKTPDVRSRIQHLFRRTRAELEWAAARRVVAAGIPTWEAVAVGRAVSRGVTADSFLISREIPHAVPVDDFVLELERRRPHRLPQLRHELARELGRLAGRLHAAGLWHRDFHAGNVLMRVTADDRVQLWLIDLHAVTAGGRPNIKRVRANLSLLFNFFATRTTAADRRRFFDSYLGQLQHRVELPVADLSRDVEQYCQRALLENYRRGDRKWIEGNRRLIIADRHGLACRGLAWIGADELCTIRDDRRRLPAPSRRTRITFNRRSVDVCVQCFPNDAEHAARGNEWSPARRGWEMGNALFRRGFGVQRPILCVERDDASWLLTEQRDAAPLHEAIRRCSPGTRADIVERTAAVVRKLHELGFAHGSLSGESIRVEDDHGVPSIALSTFEATTQSPATSRNDRLGDLGALLHDVAGVVRRVDCMRFLSRYLGREFNADWKHWWRAVEDMIRPTSPVRARAA